MITFVRTESTAPGKLVEALTFTQQIAAFVEKIIGHKVGVSVPVGGNPFRRGRPEAAAQRACAGRAPGAHFRPAPRGLGL
jgi:hypothetical protein